jgi:hypothetical protein
MSELERIPEKQDKWSDFQKKYNSASKSIVSVITANISLYVCLLLPFVMVGFIWTEVGAPVFGSWLVMEAALTLALFIVGELMMMRVGASGGRLDADYLSAKKEYTSLVERVNTVLGTMLMPMFCEWQIDIEYEQAITNRLKGLKMKRDEWETIKTRRYEELKKTYGKHKALAICSLNRLRPIELNEAMLIYGSAEERFSRGGIPMSGEDYMRRKSHSIEMILGAGFTCLLSVSFAVTLTSDISIARVMYTVTRLAFLLYRMANGYAIGAKSYHTVEVCQLRAKSKFLREYDTFVSDKIYLKLGDKYGDIDIFEHEVAEEAPALVATETN